MVDFPRRISFSPRRLRPVRLALQAGVCLLGAVASGVADEEEEEPPPPSYEQRTAEAVEALRADNHTTQLLLVVLIGAFLASACFRQIQP